MNDARSQLIWNPEIGITDFDVDPSELASSEIPGIRAVWDDQRTRLKGTEQLTEFTQRLSREWAIETGIIENLYDIERGITQTLIERGFQAEFLSQGTTNKPKEFVIRLLRDQQDALEGVFDFVKDRRILSTSYIKELHALLVRSQDKTEAVTADGDVIEVPLLKGEWKQTENYPCREGVVYKYCPPEHTSSEMDRLVGMHLQHSDAHISPEVQAAWLHHRFTQIHPFQDGNGRVARALASLVLVKEGLFPLVVTRDDKGEYVDSLEQADDGDLKPLVKLFSKLQRKQFTKASAISEAMLSTDADLQVLLSGFQTAVDTKLEERFAQYAVVFEIAEELQADIERRLESLREQIDPIVAKLDKRFHATVRRSNTQTDHYYRSQIIEVAKEHLGYFANTAAYRAWVEFNLFWGRKAKLVFAFHGIGRPFNGSLICAPFLEFRDLGRSSLFPVAEEGFVFFYNEKKEKVLDNFRIWREQTVKVALKEIVDGF